MLKRPAVPGRGCHHAWPKRKGRRRGRSWGGKFSPLRNRWSLWIAAPSRVGWGGKESSPKPGCLLPRLLATCPPLLSKPILIFRLKYRLANPEGFTRRFPTPTQCSIGKGLAILFGGLDLVHRHLPSPRPLPPPGFSACAGSGFNVCSRG